MEKLQKTPKEKVQIQGEIDKLSQKIKTIMENYKTLYLKKNLIKEAIIKANDYKKLIDYIQTSHQNVETAFLALLKSKKDKKVGKDAVSKNLKAFKSKKEMLKDAIDKMLEGSKLCKKWVKKVSTFEKNEQKLKKLNMNL